MIDPAVIKEVVRELVFERGGNEADVEEVLEVCNGNPWDAGIIYSMMQLVKADPNIDI